MDVSQTFQTIDGMGTNINVNNWKGGQLRPALDHLVDRNGCSLLRVVRDPMDWVSAESDITLLHSLDPATLTRIYEAPRMQDIWNTIGYLNQKGVRGNQIILNFMGWTPPWLGGSGAYGSASHITAGKEPKFATMVASLVYYGRMVKGLDFTLLAPMNEPDLDGKEGPLVGPAQYVTVLKALIAELDAMGLTDVRIVGPDTAGSPSSYISAMMADATVRGRVDHLAFHIYAGSTSPGTAYSGKNYWLTESRPVVQHLRPERRPVAGRVELLRRRATTSSCRISPTAWRRCWCGRATTASTITTTATAPGACWRTTRTPGSTRRASGPTSTPS